MLFACRPDVRVERLAPADRCCWHSTDTTVPEAQPRTSCLAAKPETFTCTAESPTSTICRPSTFAESSSAPEDDLRAAFGDEDGCDGNATGQVHFATTLDLCRRRSGDNRDMLLAVGRQDGGDGIAVGPNVLAGSFAENDGAGVPA